jgi:hypothetical protein
MLMSVAALASERTQNTGHFHGEKKFGDLQEQNADRAFHRDFGQSLGKHAMTSGKHASSFGRRTRIQVISGSSRREILFFCFVFAEYGVGFR